ncbi:DUF3040 domain-containing protein [Isoptericola variabilis]|uniref:Transmembrane protein n=1 Tax=Isoptericola variabilis (strain 225) TaxID=743718 RepID=F6FSH9_ISOV2|nr:DUF3040 domain-containing protein [Isoptericola variabilis]AEG44046.1 hypothetical protein Isova_1277 [Isoptericola variabilis 225]TWH31766.1 Protein of unknown function (DUF3040) [Isoptericola variabilis J7]
MPLSEYEQRVLEQMERALTSDDPRLANTLQQTSRRSPLRYVLAGVGVVAGLLLLVLGAATSRPVVGVIGFVLMFAGVAYAFAAPRKSGPVGVVRPDGTVDASAGPQPGGRKAGRGTTKTTTTGDGFLARLEERWERRRREGR